MKKTNRILLAFVFASLITLSSSCPVTPGECTDVFEAADLVVTSIEETKTEEDNNLVYKIIHIVLNSAEGVVCKENVATANEHKNSIPVYYSPDPGFGNPTIVSDTTVKVGLVAVNETYSMQSDIVFAVDGYYDITAILDVNNDVNERNNDNNTTSHAVGSGKSALENSRNIIEVQNTGRKTPIIDKNGNPSYILKWDLKIIR